MSDQLRKLSQSIVEIAKEVDGHVANYGKDIPSEHTAPVCRCPIGARPFAQAIKRIGRASIQVAHRGTPLTTAH